MDWDAIVAGAVLEFETMPTWKLAILLLWSVGVPAGLIIWEFWP